MVKRMRWLLIAALIMGVGLLRAVWAQDSAISYGVPVIATIPPGGGALTYTFNGTAGELIAARAVGTSLGVDPQIALLGPEQQTLVRNDNDPNNPGSRDAHIVYRLGATGVYSVVVIGTNATAGDVVVRIDARLPGFVVGIASGTTTRADFVPGVFEQYYSVTADPGAALALTLDAETLGFAYFAQLRDPQGQLVGVVAGDGTPTGDTSATFTLPPGAGVYELGIFSTDPANGQGTVLVSAGAPLVTNVPDAPVEQAAPVIEMGPDCAARSNGGVNLNVRGGPGRSFPVVGTLRPGDAFPVTAVSDDGDWYILTLPDGQEGYVSANAAVLVGVCRTVPALARTTTPTRLPPTPAPQTPGVPGFPTPGGPITGSQSIAPVSVAMRP